VLSSIELVSDGLLFVRPAVPVIEAGLRGLKAAGTFETSATLFMPIRRARHQGHNEDLK
jgi:hypothetical protein